MLCRLSYASHREAVKLPNIPIDPAIASDFLGRDRELNVAEGDLIAIMSAGAYGMTMSSNYNTRPRAAEVMINGTDMHLIRERENVAQLFATERLLP